VKRQARSSCAGGPETAAGSSSSSIPAGPARSLRTASRCVWSLWTAELRRRSLACCSTGITSRGAAGVWCSPQAGIESRRITSACSSQRRRCGERGRCCKHRRSPGARSRARRGGRWLVAQSQRQSSNPSFFCNALGALARPPGRLDASAHISAARLGGRVATILARRRFAAVRPSGRETGCSTPCESVVS
jgi:hypothetical protein